MGAPLHLAFGKGVCQLRIACSRLQKRKRQSPVKPLHWGGLYVKIGQEVRKVDGVGIPTPFFKPIFKSLRIGVNRMNKVTEAVTKIAEPVARDVGCSLWDVEYSKEAGQWFLRIYIDKAEGVSIEDCEKVSRTLDPMLDELDVIPGQYIFEVSSAGAERQLKRPGDFAQFMGHKIELKLYRTLQGAKEHVGTLVSYENGDVGIEANGELQTFEKADIAMVRLRIA